MLMRIKGIKKVTVRRAGKTYIYFRHRLTGERIKAPVGTADFAAEVAKLDARVRSKVALPGSLGELALLYKAAPEYTGLALRTRRDYAKVLLWLAPVEDIPLISIDTRFIYGLRDRAYAQHKRRFSTYVVQVIRLLLEWGKLRNYLETNPAKGIKAVRRPKGMARANRAWTDDERETVLLEAKKHLRTLIALGMFAGLSEGDAIRWPWSSYEKSVIQGLRAKTGEPLWIPAHFRLRQILDDADKVSPVIGVNTYGQPFTESGFRASFFKLIRKLEVAGKVGPSLTFHGLRHTVGKLIIDAGGDTRDVGAVLGHASEVSSEHYSREADRRKRASATIKRLERVERKRMDKLTDNSSVISTDEKAKALK